MKSSDTIRYPRGTLKRCESDLHGSTHHIRKHRIIVEGSMNIGLGIDTGGTCTDAVLYDFDAKKVVASAKSVTTKEDLSIGILSAIDSLPAERLPEVTRVALSTTLATNACVENKGGRAKLLMINAYRKVVEESGKHYGLPVMEEIRFLDMSAPIDQTDKNPVSSDFGADVAHPDMDMPMTMTGVALADMDVSPLKAGESLSDPWVTFFDENSDWFRDAESFGIVELDAALNGAVLEKTAKTKFAEQCEMPAIGSYELFAEPNVLQRGAGTLLNARLMPVIGGFLASVRRSLRQRGIKAPVVIVRSDGTLMSESFTGVRPVETLLCGPAASVMGGMALSGARDSLIVDMGGTTTDMAIVRNGIPLKARDGVRIGKWKTYVKGVYIDTFGLGGDSAIRHTQHGHLHLDSARVMPLSMAASRWPQIVPRLERLLGEKTRHSLPLHEFFALVRDPDKMPDASSRYTERELTFCRSLGKGPLIWADAAAAMGLDIYNLDTKRLEREGVIIRCGLTPTDLMHVRGEFNRYDAKAAELGLRFVSACCDMEPENLVEAIYDRIKKTLYIHLVQLLLEESDPYYRKHGLGHGLERLIAARWDAFRGEPVRTGRADHPENPLLSWQKAKPETQSGEAAGLLSYEFRTPSVLVAIGAPTHLFLPDVARALGTTCVIPEHAGVANAIGAVMSHVSAEVTVDIRLEGGPGGFAGFRVRGITESRLIEDRDEAILFARQEAESEAVAEALRRGALGEISVTSVVSGDAAEARGGAVIELGISVTATAVGGAGIG